MNRLFLALFINLIFINVSLANPYKTFFEPCEWFNRYQSKIMTAYKNPEVKDSEIHGLFAEVVSEMIKEEELAYNIHKAPIKHRETETPEGFCGSFNLKLTSADKTPISLTFGNKDYDYSPEQIPEILSRYNFTRMTLLSPLVNILLQVRYTKLRNKYFDTFLRTQCPFRCGDTKWLSDVLKQPCGETPEEIRNKAIMLGNDNGPSVDQWLQFEIVIRDQKINPFFYEFMFMAGSNSSLETVWILDWSSKVDILPRKDDEHWKWYKDIFVMENYFYGIVLTKNFNPNYRWITSNDPIDRSEQTPTHKKALQTQANKTEAKKPKNAPLSKENELEGRLAQLTKQLDQSRLDSQEAKKAIKERNVKLSKYEQLISELKREVNSKKDNDALKTSQREEHATLSTTIVELKERLAVTDRECLGLVEQNAALKKQLAESTKAATELKWNTGKEEAALKEQVQALHQQNSRLELELSASREKEKESSELSTELEEVKGTNGQLRTELNEWQNQAVSLAEWARYYAYCGSTAEEYNGFLHSVLSGRDAKIGRLKERNKVLFLALCTEQEQSGILRDKVEKTELQITKEVREYVFGNEQKRAFQDEIAELKEMLKEAQEALIASEKSRVLTQLDLLHRSK